jgi:dUTP pyrophosphatase
MIDVGVGVIDHDYRGNISVLLFNHTDSKYVVSHYNCITQLILECIENPDIIEVEFLDDTTHGQDGFGSTSV